jgi:hypothetical protein
MASRKTMPEALLNAGVTEDAGAVVFGGEGGARDVAEPADGVLELSRA